jgi:hypothetical protein
MFLLDIPGDESLQDRVEIEIICEWWLYDFVGEIRNFNRLDLFQIWRLQVTLPIQFPLESKNNEINRIFNEIATELAKKIYQSKNQSALCLHIDLLHPVTN